MLAGAALLRAGVGAWGRVPLALRLVGGVLALWLAWLAVVQAHRMGVNFLLSVLLLVWVADIFAYFAGRAFGLKFTRNKLAPSISPGKSWEGVWGGMAGVLVLASSRASPLPHSTEFHLWNAVRSKSTRLNSSHGAKSRMPSSA